MTTTTPTRHDSPGHFVDGHHEPGWSGRTGPVFNPATGEQIRETAFANEAEVDGAVRSARAAADAWAGMPLTKRNRIMFSIRGKLQEHQRELAELIVEENGKTISDAVGEITRGIESVEFACGIPELLKGSLSREVSTGVDVYSLREPLGVIAGITPLNFPVMVPLWMMANALACGNTFVLKPSEKCPSAPLRLAELMLEAGLPQGVLNVVNGDKVAVDALLDHSDVDGVSFVGSTPIAKYVYQVGTGSGKRVQALGGAKNHMVVLPDANIEDAADAAIAAGFGSAGERCMAISVVAPVGDVADPLLDAIRDRMARLEVGPGMQSGVYFGPLITSQHRDRVAGYLGEAVDSGAELAVDGREHPLFDTEGFFIGPSLIDRVTSAMSVYTDEIFGPVLSVTRVDAYEDALRLVNEHPLGNGSALFTASGRMARRFRNECRIGMVGINVSIPVPVAWHSFGGWKASLFGDLHMYGPEGVHFYTRQKVTTERWPS